MSQRGIVTLGSLRIQAQERSDQLNSSFIAVSEWNKYVSGSYKELYDLLIAAYGSEYHVATPAQFTTDGSSQLYPLPNGVLSFTNGITQATFTAPAFYKLLGVDLAIQPGNTGSFVTIRPFTFAERNRYAVPNFQSFYGVTNLRYRLQGDNIWFTPIPTGGQNIQLWYIPRPSDVQVEVTASYTNGNATVTCSDTSALSVGMQIQAPGALTAFGSGVTITAITPNVSFMVSAAPSQSGTNQLIRAWNDSATIDGVSGWEEYVIVDAALKAMGKEETDPSLIAQQKLMMKQRLQDMAANRDAGNPARVADVQQSDYWFPTGNGNGSGWGAF